MVAMFIINFNRQQIKKHTDKAAKSEENRKANIKANSEAKETINE
jgi:hypothetical protein